MADEPQTSADDKGGKGFFKELSGSAAKRLLEPLAATAATAGTAYLMRKTTKIWNESVLPKVREKGGGKAFVKEALEQAADKLPAGSEFVRGLAKHLEDETPARETSAPAAKQPAPAESRAAQDSATDPKRERQRQERQRRRKQRQRELAKTRST